MDRLPFFIQKITSVMGTGRCLNATGRWQKGDSFRFDLSGSDPHASGSTDSFSINAEGSGTSLVYTVSGPGMDQGRIEVVFRYCGSQEIRSHGPADKFVEDMSLLFGLNNPSIHIYDNDGNLVSKTPPSAAAYEQDTFFMGSTRPAVSVN